MFVYRVIYGTTILKEVMDLSRRLGEQEERSDKKKEGGNDVSSIKISKKLKLLIKSQHAIDIVFTMLLG